jgi:hypothetical protein
MAQEPENLTRFHGERDVVHRSPVVESAGKSCHLDSIRHNLVYSVRPEIL